VGEKTARSQKASGGLRKRSRAIKSKKDEVGQEKKKGAGEKEEKPAREDFRRGNKRRKAFLLKAGVAKELGGVTKTQRTSHPKQR